MRSRAFYLVAVFSAVACGHPGYPPSSPHPLLGQPLPLLSHRSTLDGQPFDPRGLAGKPVLVKFFAEYCAPCKETLPAVERIAERHPGVQFVGIDEDESAETARSLVQRFGLSFPVIHDEGNVLSGRFRVQTLPMTFVVDATGIVRWVGDEKQVEDDLRRAVSAAE
jgi:thiol-disulfide isomerase/thioredoxin